MEVKENDLLRDYPGEMSANNLEKPVANLTVIGTGEQSMGEITAVLRLAESASWTGSVSEDSI